MELKELERTYTELGGEVKKFKKERGKIEIGYRIRYSKKISEVDVFAFGLMSGDWNPIHFDEEFASKTRFAGRVVHGMLTTNLVSAAVAKLSGTAVLIETKFSYLKPVRIGETVEVVCEITEIKGNKYTLKAECFTEEKVVEGEVQILLW
jgi:3-hydroxybutyryl-CoA dehydratase